MKRPEDASAMMARVRGGSALVEVLAALTILAIAGVGCIVAAGQGLGTMRTMRRADQNVAAASRLMNEFALASRDALASSLGTQRISYWNVHIESSGADLYAVSILDTLTGAPLLETIVYRPAPHAPDAP